MAALVHFLAPWFGRLPLPSCAQAVAPWSCKGSTV